jgi:L-alanine-DL-glutamate epimerase-like enolase superfamily enzyme
MELVDHRLEKLTVPVDPGVSDARHTFETAHTTYLELHADTGEVGVGLGWAGEEPPAEHARRFESVWDHLAGEHPFRLRNELRLPGSGAYPGGFRRAVDFALWDLCGERLGLPVYELMGGTDPEVPGYASGLAFEHADAEARAVYETFADLGFDAAKVKVGYETVAEDVDRLRLVQEILGEDALLAIDLNETWTPKRTLRRLRKYGAAGLDVYWVEDPVPHGDVAGLERVAANAPTAYLNLGEYVGFDGKRELLARGAVDMLNLRSGLYSEALNAAAVGDSGGALLHVGDAQCELGVHLAAALPGDHYLEYWRRPWHKLTDGGVTVSDGTLVAPDGPGHGVTVSEDTIERYGV